MSALRQLLLQRRRATRPERLHRVSVAFPRMAERLDRRPLLLAAPASRPQDQSSSFRRHWRRPSDPSGSSAMGIAVRRTRAFQAAASGGPIIASGPILGLRRLLGLRLAGLVDLFRKKRDLLDARLAFLAELVDRDRLILDDLIVAGAL